MPELKKKDIKEFFSAIRSGNLAVVQSLLDLRPELLTACFSAPPKKDDGQSPLQVSIKSSNFEIAEFLLAKGADVNFMETSSVNEWRAPVLHDAIRATVFTTGWNKGAPSADHDRAFNLLKQLIRLGANPKALDSYGNNALLRVLMDIRQFFSSDPSFPNYVSNQALFTRCNAIVAELLQAGADSDARTVQRRSAREFAHEPAMAQLLK